MTTRRDVLKKLAVGTASAATVAGAGRAAADALAPELVELGDAAAALLSQGFPQGPAPWWLLHPIGVGTVLGYGWYVVDLSGVAAGAAVLTVGHSTGRKVRVHLCAHDGRPKGVAHTRLVDLVLMDGSTGSQRTDERLGRVILGLAERIRRNEANPQGDLVPVARMMTHEARVGTFGPDTLLG